MSKKPVTTNERIRDAFNDQWPKGTEVILIKDSETIETQTVSKAWMRGDEAVVAVHHVSGGYSLSRVIPINHENEPLKELSETNTALLRELKKMNKENES